MLLGFRALSAALQFNVLLMLLSYAALPQVQDGPPPQAADKVTANVNEVLVPVVVRNTQGEAVSTLTKEDFQIFDDGKLQTLAGFTIVQAGKKETGDTNSTVATIAAPDSTRASVPTQMQRYIALVFDDLNLRSNELAAAQQAVSKLLDTSLGGSDTAAVMSTSGTNSGLTQDRGKLKEAILKLKTQNTYLPNQHDCPNLDYYQADLIQDQGNGPAFDAAVSDAMICAGLPKGAETAAVSMVQEAASRVVNMMEANFRANLAFLRLVFTKMEALPGRHIVILISPGFLTPTPEAVRLKSELVDIASRGNVTINAVDARGLYTANLEASGNGENPGAAPLNTEYRQTSALAQENVMAELADGTGGMYLHHTNRIDLSSLFEGPKFLYLLSYSPAEVKANGSYHVLKVKVRPGGFTVEARRGYVAPKAQKSK